MTFEIEKGVAQVAPRPIKYPCGRMEAGDSFFVQSQDVDHKLQNKLSAACAYWSNRYPGLKFSVRRVDGGYRVWCVSSRNSPNVNQGRVSEALRGFRT